MSGRAETAKGRAPCVVQPDVVRLLGLFGNWDCKAACPKSAVGVESAEKRSNAPFQRRLGRQPIVLDALQCAKRRKTCQKSSKTIPRPRRGDISGAFLWSTREEVPRSLGPSQHARLRGQSPPGTSLAVSVLRQTHTHGLVWLRDDNNDRFHAVLVDEMPPRNGP